MTHFGKLLSLALCLSLLPVSSTAEAPPRPSTWVPLMPAIACDVDTEERGGWCRMFLDIDDGNTYTVFWYDHPERQGDPTWIRTGTNGDYTYIYEQTAEPIGVAL